MKKTWFSCDNAVCILTLSGLGIAIFQRASAINRMKNICIENGIDDAKCEDAMFNNRYIHQNFYALLILFFNIPSAVFYVIGMYNRQMWINNRIESNKKDTVHVSEEKNIRSAKGLYSFDFFF